jgi:hypothetical protein
MVSGFEQVLLLKIPAEQGIIAGSEAQIETTLSKKVI